MASRSGVNATIVKPPVFSNARSAGQFVESHERHAKDAPHRRANGLAIERIATGWTQHHTVRAESCGVSERAADVVGIGDTFEHQQQLRIAETASRSRPAGRSARARQPRCRSNPVIDAKSSVSQMKTGASGDNRSSADSSARNDASLISSRDDAVPASEQAADDQPALGDKQATTPEQFCVGNAPIIVEPGIVEPIDLDDGHAHTIRSHWPPVRGEASMSEAQPR